MRIRRKVQIQISHTRWHHCSHRVVIPLDDAELLVERQMGCVRLTVRRGPGPPVSVTEVPQSVLPDLIIALANMEEV